MDLKIATVTLAALILTPGLGFAVPPCYKNSQMRPIQEEAAYFQKIGVYDDADRKTADEYAAVHSETAEAVEHQYSATGDIHCGGQLGEANVTIKNDILVTAAHTVYKSGTCTPLARLSACHFTTTRDGVSEDIPIQQIVKTGYKCPSNQKQANEDDWVVLKLQKPVSSKIKPYRINTSSVVPAQSVVAVGKSLDFTRGINSKGKPIYPRHYGDCQIKDSWGDSTTNLLGTNCDSYPTSSGGGLFTTGSETPPTLLGICQSNTDRDPAKPHDGPYDSAKFDSIYVPIAGELLSTLRDLGPNPPAEEVGTEI